MAANPKMLSSTYLKIQPVTIIIKKMANNRTHFNIKIKIASIHSGVLFFIQSLSNWYWKQISINLSDRFLIAPLNSKNIASITCTGIRGSHIAFQKTLSHPAIKFNSDRKECDKLLFNYFQSCSQKPLLYVSDVSLENLPCMDHQVVSYPEYQMGNKEEILAFIGVRNLLSINSQPPSKQLMHESVMFTDTYSTTI